MLLVALVTVAILVLVLVRLTTGTGKSTGNLHNWQASGPSATLTQVFWY